MSRLSHVHSLCVYIHVCVWRDQGTKYSLMQPLPHLLCCLIMFMCFFFFQSNFTPELYYLCLSFGIFAVLATGKLIIVIINNNK